MVGLVFARSRRQLSIEAARVIREALESIEERPLAVGVFVNETPQRIREIAVEAGLDVAQLSGDESAEDVAECAQYCSVVKALRFPTNVAPEEALPEVNRYTALGLGDRLRILVDTYTPGEYGGTGQVANWSLAAELAAHADVILAGGLKPENVRSALSAVSPWGVDVSSGVEKDGAKDPRLIAAFIEAIRGAAPTGIPLG